MISSMLTNEVVILPLLFVSGIAQQLFQGLFVVTIFTHIAALFVALTFIPRMTAYEWKIPGIKNVWLKTIRVQPQDYNATFAIEFQSKDAADVYRDHPVHKEWEKQYLAIREESRSGQAGN